MAEVITRAPGTAPRGLAPSGWSLAARQLRFWLTNYRRTWRGSIYSSVLNPVLFLGAIGLGLGSLVNAHHPAQPVPGVRVDQGAQAQADRPQEQHRVQHAGVDGAAPGPAVVGQPEP